MRVTLLTEFPSPEQLSAASTTELFRKVGGNTGNMAFRHALRQQVGGVVSIVPWTEVGRVERSSTDVLVLACANQLGPHVDYGWMADALERLGLPLVAVGLGAQARDIRRDVPIHPGTERWLRVLAAHPPGRGPNLSLRGDFSFRVVEKLGLGASAVALGCPSLFISPDRAVGRAIEARNRGAGTRTVAMPGNYVWLDTLRLDRELSALAEQGENAWLVQGALPVVRFVREPESLPAWQRLLIWLHYFPGWTPSRARSFARERGKVFFDVEEWMRFYRTVDFVIGPRIHGTMLALQAGTGGLCLAQDSRIREMCEKMGVPFVTVPEARDLPALIARARADFDGAAFDGRRLGLARDFAAFLRAQGLAPSAHLAGLATDS